MFKSLFKTKEHELISDEHSAINSGSESNSNHDDNNNNVNNNCNIDEEEDDPASFYEQVYKDESRDDGTGTSKEQQNRIDDGFSFHEDYECDYEYGEHGLGNANNYNGNNTDDDFVDTVALNYDIGIANETKLCCPLCRRSKLCKFICGIRCCCCCNNSNKNNDIDDVDVDGLQDKPSNEELLSLAFMTFLTFTICQAIAAYLAKSASMMGDSAAMGVDAFTYGFNLIAERLKNKVDKELVVAQTETREYIFQLQSRALTQTETEMQPQIINNNESDDDNNSDNNKQNKDEQLKEVEQQQQRQQQLEIQQEITYLKQQQKQQQRKMKKMKLYLELIPPIISVTTLITITIFIVNQSSKILILDKHRDVIEQSNPNIIIMFIFATLNLVVDAINVCFFASADHAFGYETMEEDTTNYVQHYDYDNENDNDNHSDDQTPEIEMILSNPLSSSSSTSISTSINKSKSNGSISNGNSNGNSNSNSNKKRKNQRIKKVTDQFKFIHREQKRKKGGAYSHLAPYNTEMDGYNYDNEHEHEHDHDHSHDDDGRDDEYYNGNYEDNTMNNDKAEENNLSFTISNGDSNTDDDDHNNDHNNGNGHGNGHGNGNGHDKPYGYDEDYETHESHMFEKRNLNMCSAYTHVFADTIRSIAVLLASILAQFIPNITPEVADASAALAVSGIILIAVLPLFSGLKRTWLEIYAISREEASERLHARTVSTMSSSSTTTRDNDSDTDGDNQIITLA